MGSDETGFFSLTNEHNYNLTCLFVCPALTCEIWESLILGILFLLTSFVSFYFLYDNLRKTKKKWKICDQTNLFWLSLITFLIYRGLLFIIAPEYNYKMLKVVFIGISHVLLFIPMCLVILILFDLLFTYQNPGTNAINFFRSLFILFLFTFAALGIALSLVDLNDHNNDPEMSLSLWNACTNLILMIFFAIPAISLLKAVTYPMVQPEDKSCVNFCIVGIALNTLIFTLRLLYNFLHYINYNPIQRFLVDRNKDSAVTVDENRAIFKPCIGVRIWNFFFCFLFDYIPTVLAIIAVNLFKKHDLMFNENPYYTKQSD